MVLLAKEGTMGKTATVADEVVAGLTKKVFKMGAKNLSDRLSKVKEVPFSSIVVDTGARDYGPPPNASERRM